MKKFSTITKCLLALTALLVVAAIGFPIASVALGPSASFQQLISGIAVGNLNPMPVTTDLGANTYHYGAVANPLYSTAGAVLAEVQGSATKTVRVKRISLWANAGTVNKTDILLERSGYVSAGTLTALVAGKHDSTDGAATAVVNIHNTRAPLAAAR